MAIEDRITDYANLLQKDYQDYLNIGAPTEDQILDIANGNDKEASASKAMQLSDQAFDNAALQTNQQLARYGLRLNERQRQSKGREYAMAKVLARVNAANNTRVAESERQGQARDMALNLGSSLYSSALGKIGYAAQGATQQLAAWAAYDANKKAGRYNLAGTALSTGAGVGMMMAMSDKNKKENIRDNDNRVSLKNIMAMRTKKFNYKEDAGQLPGEHTGVLHQEAPDSIKAEHEGVKGVNVADWVGELTGAVQELGKQTQEIRAGLKRLKGKAA